MCNNFTNSALENKNNSFYKNFDNQRIRNVVEMAFLQKVKVNNKKKIAQKIRKIHLMP